MDDDLVDRSADADARRFRWMLSGNGYFMEEEMLCGHAPCDSREQDKARLKIDAAMNDEENRGHDWLLACFHRPLISGTYNVKLSLNDLEIKRINYDAHKDAWLSGVDDPRHEAILFPVMAVWK